MSIAGFRLDWIFSIVLILTTAGPTFSTNDVRSGNPLTIVAGAASPGINGKEINPTVRNTKRNRLAKKITVFCIIATYEKVVNQPGQQFFHELAG